jgi:hypothetical protein
MANSEWCVVCARPWVDQAAGVEGVLVGVVGVVVPVVPVVPVGCCAITAGAGAIAVTFAIGSSCPLCSSRNTPSDPTRTESTIPWAGWLFASVPETLLPIRFPAAPIWF